MKKNDDGPHAHVSDADRLLLEINPALQMAENNEVDQDASVEGQFEADNVEVEWMAALDQRLGSSESAKQTQKKHPSTVVTSSSSLRSVDEPTKEVDPEMPLRSYIDHSKFSRVISELPDGRMIAIGYMSLNQRICISLLVVVIGSVCDLYL